MEDCDDESASKDFMRWQPNHKKQNAAPMGVVADPSQRDHGQAKDADFVAAILKGSGS